MNGGLGPNVLADWAGHKRGFFKTPVPPNTIVNGQRNDVMIGGRVIIFWSHVSYSVETAYGAFYMTYYHSCSIKQIKFKK